MKRLFLPFLFLSFLSRVSQAQAYEATIDYDKQKQEAFVIDFYYSPEAVRNAFISRMEKLGYRYKEEKGLFNRDKGFLVFKGAFVTEAHDDRMDYIVKVEPKSRRNDNESVLYLILHKDGTNVKSNFDAEAVSKVKSFLANLQTDVGAADLELQILAQEELIAKAEKKLRDLQKDEKDLEKKLADNKKDQADTENDIKNQQAALEALKAKRTPDLKPATPAGQNGDQ